MLRLDEDSLMTDPTRFALNSIPQGLKPALIEASCGSAEAAPFQNKHESGVFPPCVEAKLSQNAIRDTTLRTAEN
jgi:hypothetical protein